ncbi:glycosyltransferase family 2 protein [Desulfovibrio sp. OttesenSCG-928-A18]|nr:glycosyltransferase family 2 protein [Desulfovibrio sp. OttesenSCG-928-A18]
MMHTESPNQENTLAVVIPAYNAAAYMRGLLTRIMSNKRVSEVIVVDDCSTDPTAKIAARFAAQDPRIRLVSQPRNLGAGAARNRGLLEVRAEYCIFLDADDRLEEQALDKAMAALDEEPADFLVFKWFYTDSEGRARAIRMYGQDEEIWDEIVGARRVLRCQTIEHQNITRTANFPWNKIYRTRFLREKRIRFSETFVHNDNLAHWMSYSLCDSFTLFNHYCIGHKEDRSYGQLTQVWDWRRMQIFDVFMEIDSFMLGLPQELHALYVHFTLYKHQMLYWIGQHISDETLPVFAAKAALAFANVDSLLFFRLLTVNAMDARDIYDIRFDPHRFFAELRARAR